MKFYDVLSDYYDIIFPLSADKLEFLTSTLSINSKVLDIACGTGSYSIALSDLGHNVNGLDLDEKMISIAKQKAHEINSKATFSSNDMLKIDKIFTNEKFDMVFCIGNSLVHLNNENEIDLLLSKIYSILNKDGSLAIQIINYDRIIKDNIDSLPTINRESEGVKFVRNYSYDKDNNKINFNTKIIVDKESKDIELNNSTPLIPLKKETLERMLIKNGFKDIRFYGSFNEDEYSTNSYATIVRAKK